MIMILLNQEPRGCTKVFTPGLKLRTDGSELLMFMEQYMEHYGDYPTEKQGIFALVELPTVPPVPKNYKPIVSNKRSVLDPWGTPYILKIDSNKDFKIITLGKDRKEGGTGKNSDFDILNEEEYPSEFRN